MTGSTVTATGIVNNTIDRRQVGVNMQVTPRITPDGRVLMRVIPEVSSVLGTVPLGNGQVSTSLNIQHLETTVSALDGETVVLGGLINSTDSKMENKVPWLGDLPGLGALFRYRTQSKKKTELLIIMTPHIVRNRYDAERVLLEESRRIDWVLGDVMRTHGNANCAPFMQNSFHDLKQPVQPFRIMPNMPATPPWQNMPHPTPLPTIEPQAKGPAIESKVSQAVQENRADAAVRPQPAPAAADPQVKGPGFHYSPQQPAGVSLPALQLPDGRVLPAIPLP